MRIKFLSILAAVALLGACETASKGDSTSSGAGTTTVKPATSAPAAAVKRVKAGSQKTLWSTLVIACSSVSISSACLTTPSRPLLNRPRG